MMYYRASLAGIVFAVTLSFAADEKKDEGIKPIVPAKLDRKDPISYEKDIRPIFAAKCTVCHSGSELKGKFDLGTYAALMKGGRSGAVIVPGKSDDSYLWILASHREDPIMPPAKENNPLTPQEVSLLKAWIDQGAKPPAVDERVRPTVVLGFPPAVVNPVRAIAVNSGTLVAAGRGNRIHIFDAKTGEYKRSLVDPALKLKDGKPADVAHMSLVESMAISPDGKTLASGSFREVLIWDLDKGIIKTRLTDFNDRVVSLDFSKDGKYLATGGGAPTETGEIKLFDTASWKLVTSIKDGHSDTVFGVCFSPDSKLLATGGADKFVKVFEVPSGKFVKAFEGHTHHVMDVGWTPDGKKLASAGADNIIKIWDYEKGEKIRDIQGHKNQVTRLVFVGKTPTFLTASGDASVRLWNADNGGQARQFTEGADFVYAVASSADGAVIATGGEEGIVRLYDGKTGKLVKALLPPGVEPEKKEEPKKK